MPYAIPPATREGRAPFRGHETWFRVTGELPVAGGSPRAPLPVVVLHGGPGAAHDYTLSMANLAARGRAVVHYDQLGCGRSTHLPQADPSSWTVELFVAELVSLLDHLGLERVHVVGQSWGGMLGPEFALAHPERLASLTICDSPASMATWREAAEELIDALPEPHRSDLLRLEAAGAFDDPAYRGATDVFYARHVCRVQPLPAEVAATFAQIEAEPTVYHAMNGPSEFTITGSNLTWTVEDRLPGITAPTLVLAGAHDEATPACWAPFVERVPDVRSHVFPESSHMPHVEEHESFLEVVGGFLTEHDPRGDQQ